MVQIAISQMVLKSKPAGKTDPAWKELVKSFRTVDVTSNELANAIYSGHAFTCSLKPCNARGDIFMATEYFAGGQHLCLDFDTETIESAIDTLLLDKFISKRATIVYGSMSSKPGEGKHRSRVVFLLDTPIMQVKNYILASKALLWLYNKADPQCSNPARPWLPNYHGELVEPNNVLPLAIVRDLIRRYEETKRKAMHVYVPRPFNGTNDDKALDYLVSKMASAGEGMRNGTLNECGFLLGRNIAEGRIDRSWGEQCLRNAALTTGLELREVELTLTHAIKDGIEANALSSFRGGNK